MIQNKRNNARFKRHCPGAKITSRVIDRALKPILGMFHGMPKNRAFRRECDRLSRDMTVRNCGPGFILRMALECVPVESLDVDFVKTEDF